MSIELLVADDPCAAALTVFRSLSPHSLVLAGGATPRPLYQRLAGLDHDWAATDVFFSDERCVPPDHPDSNYRMAWAALLSHVPARVHRMPGETCDAAAYEAELRQYFDAAAVRFDLAILGLGEEGHTASLFPGDPALDVTDRLVVRVQRPDHSRLSLTLPALSAADVALFLVAGAAKANAVRALLAGEDTPARRVRAARTLLVADPAAAGETESATEAR